MRIRISWTDIGYGSAPSSGTIVGLSFALTDKDAGGTYSKMWLSAGGANQNASNWQPVLLSGTVAAPLPAAPSGFRFR